MPAIGHAFLYFLIGGLALIWLILLRSRAVNEGMTPRERTLNKFGYTVIIIGSVFAVISYVPRLSLAASIAMDVVALACYLIGVVMILLAGREKARRRRGLAES